MRLTSVDRLPLSRAQGEGAGSGRGLGRGEGLSGQTNPPPSWSGTSEYHRKPPGDHEKPPGNRRKPPGYHPCTLRDHAKRVDEHAIECPAPSPPRRRPCSPSARESAMPEPDRGCAEVE